MKVDMDTKYDMIAWTAENLGTLAELFEAFQNETGDTDLDFTSYCDQIYFECSH